MKIMMILCVLILLSLNCNKYDYVDTDALEIANDYNFNRFIELSNLIDIKLIKREIDIESMIKIVKLHYGNADIDPCKLDNYELMKNIKGSNEYLTLHCEKKLFVLILIDKYGNIFDNSNLYKNIIRKYNDIIQIDNEDLGTLLLIILLINYSMMKKLYLTVLLFAPVLFSFYISCYYQWLNAFDAATAEYASDKAYCRTRMIATSLCLMEAEYSYTKAVNAAGDAFYNCNEY